jgi:hypothetical protein
MQANYRQIAIPLTTTSRPGSSHPSSLWYKLIQSLISPQHSSRYKGYWLWHAQRNQDFQQIRRKTTRNSIWRRCRRVTLLPEWFPEVRGYSWLVTHHHGPLGHIFQRLWLCQSHHNFGEMSMEWSCNHLHPQSRPCCTRFTCTLLVPHEISITLCR